MRLLSLALAIVVVTTAGSARADYRKLVKRGNEAAQKQDYENALKSYREAEIERPQDPLIEYNIGTALYGQTGFEDAVKRFTKALETQDEKLQADAYYNLGNSFFRAERYAEAITAYKHALELNSDDAEAKYNLELARKRLKDEAQQQQQQQNQQNQQQDQEQQQQQNEQQQQDQQQQDEQQQQQQQQGGSEQEEQQQQQQQQGEGDEDKQEQPGGVQQGEREKSQAPDEQKMSKEDAMRILRAINNDEKDMQKKVTRQRMGIPGYTGGKDW